MTRETINRRLLALAKKQERRRGWIDHVWSNDLRGAIKYTFYRSRGFIFRNISHRLVDLIETFGLCLIGHPALVKAGYAFTISSVVSVLFVGMLLFGLRGRLLLRQKPETRILGHLAQAVNLIFYGVAFFSVSSEGFLLPFLCVFLSKFLISILFIRTSVDTAVLTNIQRVYYPPVLNISSVIGACLLVGMSHLIPGMGGYYLLIAGSFGIKLISLIWPYRIACHTEKLLRLFGQYPVDSYETVGKREMYRDISSRSLLMGSGYIAPLLLSTLPGVTPLVLIWTWAYRILADSVLSRPFRSVHIDIYKAVEKRQWELLGLRLYFATRLSLALLLGFGVLVIATAAHESNWEMSLLLGWVFASCLNQWCLNRFLSVGQERVLLNGFFLSRFIAGPLLFFTANQIGYSPFLGLCLSETLNSAWTLWVSFKTSLFDRCQYAVTQVESSGGTRVWSLRDLLRTHHLISPLLKKAGLSEGTYLVTLNKRLTSDRQVESFVDRIQRIIRKTDRVALIDHSRLLLWAPFSTHSEIDSNSIRLRLLKEFPLWINDCAHIDGFDSIHEVKAEEKLMRPPSTVVRNNTALLSLLETFVHHRLPERRDGRWWVLTPKGWLGLNGYATPLRTGIFFSIHERSENAVIFHRNKMRRSDDLEECLIPFAPCGKVIAFYSTATYDEALVKVLRNLRENFVEWEASAHADLENPIQPSEWFRVVRLLDHMIETNRAKISYRIVEKHSPPQPNETVCAKTTDGQTTRTLLLTLPSPPFVTGQKKSA